MRSLSIKFFLCGLALILTSLATSGCATHDAKRDDDTYKRPTEAEKQQSKSSRQYPDLKTPVSPPEATPDMPVDQLPIVPLEHNA